METTTQRRAPAWPSRLGVVLVTSLGSMVVALVPTAIVGGALAVIAGEYYASRNGGIAPDGIGFIVPVLTLGTVFTGLIMLVVCVVNSRRNAPAVRVLDARMHLVLAALLWSPLAVLVVTAGVRDVPGPFPIGLLVVLVPPVVAVCGVLARRVTAMWAAVVLLACGPVWTVTTISDLNVGGGIVGVPFAWATTLLATCGVVLFRAGRHPVSPPTQPG